MVRFLLMTLVLVAACTRLGEVGRAPPLQPLAETPEHRALYSVPLPDTVERRAPSDGASLWSAGRRSLLGDRRARRQGDILTVVIQIDDSAEFSNTTGRNRTGAQAMSVPDLLGLPQVIDGRLPDGASMAQAAGTSGSSSFQGAGSVRRNERLTLRVAATIAEILPNGVMRIVGTQEVRVNFELRELTVAGYVRSEDITRQNEVPYDRIAGARISYGGRGLVTDAQQPRIGQQITDLLLPF